MTTPPAVPTALRNRVLAALSILAVAALAGPAISSAAPKPSVLTLKTAKVGAAGNPSVGIVPFSDAIYKSCAEAAGIKPPCQEVGGVGYGYGIGQLEITVSQYVAFLNSDDFQSGQAQGPYPKPPNHIVSIREGRWKLAKYHDTDPEVKKRKPPQWEMYDLKTDPLEKHNIAHPEAERTPLQEEELKRLKSKLARVEKTRLKEST